MSAGIFQYGDVPGMRTISTGLSVNRLITILIALFVLSAILGLCNSAYAATITGKPQAS